MSPNKNEKRILTAKKFRFFLRWLDPVEEQAGDEYEKLRFRLIAFFSHRRSLFPEDLADETINRLIHNISEHKKIAINNKLAYSFALAKDVYMESIRTPSWALPIDLVDSAEVIQKDLLSPHPLRVELIGIGRVLSKKLIKDPSLIHSISPEQFEDFICERLYAMGMEPKKTGLTNKKDGGIDILFWPRKPAIFPFLGAAQIKHHRKSNINEGSGSVRDFAGAIATHPINAGLLVTNTSFTPDARWFASQHATLIKLREFGDICRWMVSNFSDEEEWREIPKSIELCPGVIIDIPWQN